MSTATAAAGTVRKTSESLDVPLPDEFVSALDAASSLIVAAENLRGDVTQIHTLTLDALSAGRDPSGDTLVTRALARHQLAAVGCAQAAHDRGERDVGRTLIECSSQILGSWSQTLQPALDSLAAAADSRLVENLDAFNSTGASSEPAVRHWRNAVEAVRLTRIAETGILAIALAANTTPTRDAMPLVYTAATAEDLDAIITNTGTTPTVWSVAQAGLRLQMVSSLDELRSRIGDYQAQRAAQRADFEYRQTHPQRAPFTQFA